MKQNVKNCGLMIIILSMYSNLFGIAGIGLYGNYDMLSHDGTLASDDGSFTINAGPFDNAYGVGLYIYVDAIPIVDLELSFEGAGNLHDGIFIAPAPLGEFTGELPWVRASTYITVRKKIIGLSIPFLAKAKLYAGGGYNKHTVTPKYSMDLLNGAFPNMNLEEIFGLMEGDPGAITTFADHVAENMESYSGIHLQAGFQAKLVVISLFANVRYTIAKDVIPGKAGFPSAWIGLGLGL